VEIEPKVEKLPEQRKIEIIELYKIFVAEDKPDPGDAKAVEQWKLRKRTLQKMILEEFGREEYEDLIIGLEEKAPEEHPKAPAIPPAKIPAPPIAPPMEMSPEIPAGPLPTPASPTPARPASPAGIRGLITKIPLLRRIVR